MWPNPHFSADMVTFTAVILNEKFHLLYGITKLTTYILKHDKFVLVHMKNHSYFAAEVVQVKNNHFPEITKGTFIFQENEI